MVIPAQRSYAAHTKPYFKNSLHLQNGKYFTLFMDFSCFSDRIMEFGSMFGYTKRPDLDLQDQSRGVVAHSRAGAEGGSRTHMRSPSTVFESPAHLGTMMHHAVFRHQNRA